MATADTLVGMVRYLEKLPPTYWWIVGGLMWVLTTSTAFGANARVLRIGSSQTNIAVSHPDTAPWILRDRVCVVQLRSTIACGRVMKVTTKGVIVKLDAPSADVIAGDSVVAESQTMGGGAGAPASGNLAANSRGEPQTSQQVPRVENHVRRPSQITPPKAQLLDSVRKHPQSDDFNFNLSAGTSISFSFFYPTVNFQYAFAPEWAIGLMPMGLFAGATGASLTGFGGYATLNYYSQKYFRGLWVQGGLGSLYFTVTGPTVSESANALAAIGTVGWRGYWDLGLNIGVGAGVQYIQNPAFTTITVESAGVLPLVILDVGINF